MLYTPKDNFINIASILYVIIGFLGLQFLNGNRSVDLRSYCIKFYHIIIYNMSIFEIYKCIITYIHNIYIQILYKIIRYVKSQIIKRHLYWSHPIRDLDLDRYYNIRMSFNKYIHPSGIYNIIETRIRKILYR